MDAHHVRTAGKVAILGRDVGGMLRQFSEIGYPLIDIEPHPPQARGDELLDRAFLPGFAVELNEPAKELGDLEGLGIDCFEDIYALLGRHDWHLCFSLWSTEVSKKSDRHGETEQRRANGDALPVTRFARIGQSDNAITSPWI